MTRGKTKLHWDAPSHLSMAGTNQSKPMCVSWPLLGWCQWGYWAGAGSCCWERTPLHWERSCGYLQRPERHRWERILSWWGHIDSIEHRPHLHELWSRNSPEPSQFRKSPVSTQRRRKEKWPTSPIVAQFNTWIQTMWNNEWYNKPEANLLSGHINYLL